MKSEQIKLINIFNKKVDNIKEEENEEDEDEKNEIILPEEDQKDNNNILSDNINDLALLYSILLKIKLKINLMIIKVSMVKIKKK